MKTVLHINFRRLTTKLDPLAIRHNIGSISPLLCLTLDFATKSWLLMCPQHYKELATYVPPTLARPHNTRQAAASHDYRVAVGYSRVVRFENCMSLLLEALELFTPLMSFPITMNWHTSKHRSHFLQNSQILFLVFFSRFINLSYTSTESRP